MRTLVRIKFGSHLYGTATPASDIDFKSIFVPDAHDILLQRAKGSVSNQRPKAEGEKNVAGGGLILARTAFHRFTSGERGKRSASIAWRSSWAMPCRA